MLFSAHWFAEVVLIEFWKLKVFSSSQDTPRPSPKIDLYFFTPMTWSLLHFFFSLHHQIRLFYREAILWLWHSCIFLTSAVYCGLRACRYGKTTDEKIVKAWDDICKVLNKDHDALKSDILNHVGNKWSLFIVNALGIRWTYEILCAPRTYQWYQSKNAN